MKHLIMGTAGHIDHGKTSLIKALTGIDCDTHKEEKLRGITINLGFAHLKLSSGMTVSIVDVPGHRDFIHTMVAGASGIDFVVMVIASDSGIMPQTMEHLHIMRMLNISHGIIALTKIDLVDSNRAAMAQAEVRQFTKGTFLEQSPLVPVSAKTGEGIDLLKRTIEDYVATVPQRQQGEIFRLFIDRIFSVSGFGTVVTGSVLSGSIKTGDTAYLLPIRKKLRIRRLEQHGLEVNSVLAGDRASLNLVGLNREDFKRGMCISDRMLRGTQLIDAHIQLFEPAKLPGIWNDVLFLLGTYEAQGKMHLLDRDTVSGGQEALVQLHLPVPCTICISDRFVLRNTSHDATLGGGRVIDAAPLHHRRRPESLISNLQRVAQGDLSDRIAYEVRKEKTFVRDRDLVERLNLDKTAIKNKINEKIAPDIQIFKSQESVYLITAKEKERIASAVLRNMEAFHSRNPLNPEGRSSRELVAVLGDSQREDAEDFTLALLEYLVTQNTVKRVGGTWALSRHTASVSEEFTTQCLLIDNFLKGFGLHVPSNKEVAAYALKTGIDVKTLQLILKQLTDKKRIYQSDDEYIHADIVNSVRMKLLKALTAKPEGLTVALFRDLIADNRKICLRLFAIYDAEGITIRKGDVRIISEKGKKVYAENSVQ